MTTNKGPDVCSFCGDERSVLMSAGEGGPPIEVPCPRCSQTAPCGVRFTTPDDIRRGLELTEQGVEVFLRHGDHYHFYEGRDSEKIIEKLEADGWTIREPSPLWPVRMEYHEGLGEWVPMAQKVDGETPLDLDGLRQFDNLLEVHAWFFPFEGELTLAWRRRRENVFTVEVWETLGEYRRETWTSFALMNELTTVKRRYWDLDATNPLYGWAVTARFPRRSILDSLHVMPHDANGSGGEPFWTASCPQCKGRRKLERTASGYTFRCRTSWCGFVGTSLPVAEPVRCKCEPCSDQRVSRAARLGVVLGKQDRGTMDARPLMSDNRGVLPA